MHYLPAVLKAITERLKGDEDLMSLLGDGFGVYAVRGANRAEFPYVVVNLVANDWTDSMRQAGAVMTIQVDSYFAAYPPDNEDYDPVERAGGVLGRIYGDWNAGDDESPGYGLHRWTIDLDGSGWTACGPMLETAATYSNGELMGTKVFSYTQTYRLHVVRDEPEPEGE